MYFWFDFFPPFSFSFGFINYFLKKQLWCWSVNYAWLGSLARVTEIAGLKENILVYAVL